MVIARATIHNLQGRNHSLAYLLLNVQMQAGSGISVSILVHSFVTLCTVRLSNLPGIKSEQIIPITPSRLWTPSSPCPTSSSAPRPHHIRVFARPIALPLPHSAVHTTGPKTVLFSVVAVGRTSERERAMERTDL